jgi:hypothetical protein
MWSGPRVPPGYTSSFQQAAKHWNVTSCVVPSLSSEGIHEGVCEEALKIQKRRRVPRECVCERQRERERERCKWGRVPCKFRVFTTPPRKCLNNSITPCGLVATVGVCKAPDRLWVTIYSLALALLPIILIVFLFPPSFQNSQQLAFQKLMDLVLISHELSTTFHSPTVI